MTSYRLKAYFYLLLVSLFWGAATPVIKFTLGGISPFSFLVYRFFISAILGLAILLITKARIPKPKENLPLIVVYGVVTTTVALGFLFLGLNKTTVLDTVLITAVSPLVTAVAGSFFLKETITTQEKIGILIAFSGTLFTILEPVFRGKVDITQLTGNFLVLGYLISYGVSSVLSKKLVRNDVKPLDLSNFSFIIGFLTIIPLVPFEASFANVVSTVSNLAIPFHLGVLYMAIFSGTTAYALWIKGQKSIEISEAGVFGYLMPLFSTPLAVFWLGEEITPFFVNGAMLIAIGVFVAEYKTQKA
jgi:drug/metabolite transporter (DMT)-like permease